MHFLFWEKIDLKYDCYFQGHSLKLTSEFFNCNDARTCSERAKTKNDQDNNNKKKPRNTIELEINRSKQRNKFLHRDMPHYWWLEHVGNTALTSYESRTQPIEWLVGRRWKRSVVRLVMRQWGVWVENLFWGVRARVFWCTNVNEDIHLIGVSFLTT